MKNIITLIIFFLFLHIGIADQRHFVWTYESMTMQAGEAEL